MTLGTAYLGSLLLAVRCHIELETFASLAASLSRPSGYAVSRRLPDCRRSILYLCTWLTSTPSDSSRQLDSRRNTRHAGVSWGRLNGHARSADL